MCSESTLSVRHNTHTQESELNMIEVAHYIDNQIWIEFFSDISELNAYVQASETIKQLIKKEDIERDYLHYTFDDWCNNQLTIVTDKQDDELFNKYIQILRHKKVS